MEGNLPKQKESNHLMSSMMIKAVVDTNVWLSGLLWKGAPYRVVQFGTRGTFVVLTSPGIIREVEEKLRDKFHFADDKVDRWLRLMQRRSLIIESTRKLNVVPRDPDDNMIVECAVDGRANYIVTGDKDLLVLERYEGVEIIKPAVFLKKL